MKNKPTILLFLLLGMTAATAGAVRTGLDNVDTHAALFAGERVGLIVNHTACRSDGAYIVDVFRDMPGVRVTALFSPEHGLHGAEAAGEKVGDQVDPVYGLPVHSLYGQTKKPTPEMLADVDVLVFDMQDVGARFYTYVYTMSLAMEAAAEHDKRFVVLDRPNPINGREVEGPLLERRLASFVGLYPIPVRHGLTVGELARLINGQGWLAGGARVDLAVVPLAGWRRDMWYDETGLRFIKPSPNMPDVATATVYPGLCLLEGTNISEGRGTPRPFRQFGAPWIDAYRLAAQLNGLGLLGVRFAPTSFVPTASKHSDQTCHGCSIVITDRDRLKPFRSGLAIVRTLHELYPRRVQWKVAHFDRLCGTDAVRRAIIDQVPLEKLEDGWQTDAARFRETRRPYLLYPE
jgi:uncharacterized protein YbbC (DUF1343 family)